MPFLGRETSVHDERSFGRLAHELANAPTFQDSVSQVVTFAAQTFDTSFAGITLIRRGGRSFETAGPTDDVVRIADDWQARLREGPCVLAASESRHVVSNDIAADPRWPRWGPKAAELGLGSIMSSELHAGGTRIGALNVYGLKGREFVRDDVETAQVLAYHASAALRMSQQIDDLTVALDSRTVIGQAQGILMARFELDPDRAFAVLRRLSQSRNVKLRAVAEMVVESGKLPELDA